MGWQDAPEVGAGPKWAAAPPTAPDPSKPLQPWEDPANPVVRDLKTIPVAAKHALKQALGKLGVLTDQEVKADAEKMKASPMYSELGAVLGPALLTAPLFGAVGAGGAALSTAAKGAQALQTMKWLPAAAEAATNVAGSTAIGTTFSEPGEEKKGAVWGAVTGAGGEVLKQALPAVAHEVANRFLNNVAGRIAAKNNLSREATTAAYEAGAIRPLKTIGRAADTLENAVNVADERIVDVITEAGRQGAEGPPKQFLVQSLKRLGRQVEQMSADAADYMPYYRMADEIASKTALPSGNLSLAQSEAIKSSLQRMAKRAYATLQGGDTPATPGALRHIASGVRRANERAVQLGASPQVYNEFLAAKEGFGPLRDAFRAAGEGAARAGNRSFIGMPEAVMLGAHGMSPAAQLKVARVFLPQTIGYTAWRGGQAMNDPLMNAVMKSMALQSSMSNEETPSAP